MNSITGVVICQNNAQRTNVKNALAAYAGNHGLNVGDLTLDIDSNKYGVGPAFILNGWFEDDRAEANEAWVAMDTANRPFIRGGSFLIQMDGETVIHHETWTLGTHARVVVI
jgi:hypothetical protein